MESANDVDMLKVNGNYDIFENSSPQRPITSHGEFAPADSVDQILTSNHHVVNFSRKRGPQDGRTPYEQSNEHGSKRHRHAQWRAKVEAKENDAPPDADITSPARPSKFKEGSMNDKPSAKPPSMFTRHMDQYVNMANEQLMGEYHVEQEKPLPPNPSMYSLHRLSRSPDRKRASAPVAASTFSLDTQDEKTGGIFRFGKSMASAFNPMNVWSRFTTGWRAAKEELVEEAEDARKKKAEAAYAAMKQEGKLGGLSSNAFSNAPVFTPGYTQAASKSENQRDSGISMATTTRPSVDSSNQGSLLDPEASPKKSRKHGRTPSFQDLKKVASTINLHRRSASSSRSPAKEDMDPYNTHTERLPRSKSRGNVLEFFGDNIGSLRNSISKGNLTDEYDEFGNRNSRKEQAKQVKLTKRVSDLEAKLDSARRELDRALGHVPPVPMVPPQLNRQAVPRFERNSDGSRGGFVPALETVLSESLLLPPTTEASVMIADDARTVATADVLHDELVSVADTDGAGSVKYETSNGGAADILYTHQNDQLLKGDITNTPRPSTPDRDSKKSLKVVLKTTSDPATAQEQTFLNETSSPAIDSAKKASGGSGKKKKKRNSTGKSKADRTYRPGSESNIDDEAEWKDVRKSKAKKRKSDENLAQDDTKRTKPSRLPVSPQAKKSGTSTQQHKVLRKPVPSKTLPPTPLDMAATERGSLDLDPVPEDVEVGAGISFTSVVPAKTGPSRKPTAKATPAVFHTNYRSPASASPEPFPRSATSSSPVREREHHQTSFGSPKRKRKVLTPKRGDRRARDERSKSPPVSSGRVKDGKGFLKAIAGTGDAVVKRPNGRDVPEMPAGVGGKGKLESKSSFEWDKEVF